jgi:hypothetical protein
MRTLGVLLACALGAASGLRLTGVTVPAAPTRSRACAPMACQQPISEESSLAEMRDYIAECGLDVKTTGKGRTKAVIYEELVAALAARAPPAPAPDAGVEKQVAPPEAPEMIGIPPKGFEWGGIF